MSKRIFLGGVDICGQIGDFKRAYEKIGFKTFTFVFTESESFKNENEYSFVLYNLYPRILLEEPNIFLLFLRKIYTFLVITPVFFLTFIRSVFLYDIYIFIWLTDSKWKYVLWLLKKFNKKIFVMFVGSDVRWRPIAIKDYKKNNVEFSPLLENINDYDISILNDRLRTIRICEKYSTLISSTPDQAQLQLRPYISFGLPIDYEKINLKISQNNIPKVSIGITEPSFKGSYLILEELNKAKEKLNFDLIVIENMPHSIAIEMLNESDIFIYSPYGLSLGKFGFEAMASGALLLTGHDHKYVKYPAEEPPLVHITSKDMIEKLKYYLDHKVEREDLIKKARIWVEKYCNEELVYKKILDCLVNKNYYDIKPEYFRNYTDFTGFPESEEYLKCCNKWTKYAQKCEWYKKYVKTGERDGLIF